MLHLARNYADRNRDAIRRTASIVRDITGAELFHKLLRYHSGSRLVGVGQNGDKFLAAIPRDKIVSPGYAVPQRCRDRFQAIVIQSTFLFRVYRFERNLGMDSGFKLRCHYLLDLDPIVLYETCPVVAEPTELFVNIED